MASGYFQNSMLKLIPDCLRCTCYGLLSAYSDRSALSWEQLGRVTAGFLAVLGGVDVFLPCLFFMVCLGEPRKGRSFPSCKLPDSPNARTWHIATQNPAGGCR